MTRSALACIAALSFALLVGDITDRTTGQPLAGVHVWVAQGRVTLHAVTGRDGRFRLSGLRAGSYVLYYSSDDVPPQQVAGRVRGGRATVHITACSTTLDYSCAGGGGG